MLALPASALGATVSVTGGVLTFTAAAGEANNVTVHSGPTGYDISEKTVTITPGGGCTTSGAGMHHATCPSAGVAAAVFDLGDRDDHFTSQLQGTPTVVHGGDGNDTLAGGSGDDSFDGGAGADKFSDSGGVDTVSYADRTAPVTVSLDGRPGDGEAGEGDNVGAGIDNVVGGAGNDVLTGNAGANLITGGAGSDTIACGDGSDTVANDAWDHVATDCETLGAPVDPAGGGGGDASGGADPAARPVPAELLPRLPEQTPVLGPNGTVALRVSCPATAVGGCAGTIALQLPGASAGKLAAARRRKVTSVGARRFTLAAGTTQSLPVHLSRKALRRLHARHKLVVRAVVAVTVEGTTATSSRTVKILERRTKARHPTRRRRR